MMPSLMLFPLSSMMTVCREDYSVINRLTQLEKEGEEQMASVYRDKLISDYVQSLLSKKK